MTRCDWLQIGLIAALIGVGVIVHRTKLDNGTAYLFGALLTSLASMVVMASIEAGWHKRGGE